MAIKILGERSDIVLVNFLKIKPVYYAGIKGTGYYVPERVVTNKELEQYVNTTDEWIQRKIGIKERRIAAEHEATSDLAYRAALMAIEDAGIVPEDIDLIIVNCICPDYKEPATAHIVQQKLGAVNSATFDINAGGCPGNVYAINVGCNFVVNGACDNVLVIGADIMSSIIDWRDRSTCCFFGDGAGAIIIGRTTRPGFLGYSMYADSQNHKAAIVPLGGTKSRSNNVNINIGLKDNMNFLSMDGKAIWDFATHVFPESIKELVYEIGGELPDIDVIIPHQANINIVKEGMRKMEIPFEKAFVNLDRYGNTAGASVFIALAEAVRAEKIFPGSRVALSAFGGGLAWGAVLLEWNHTKDFVA